MKNGVKALTETSIQNLKPPTDKPQKEYWDRLVPGFGVRVGAKGTKAFFVMAKVLSNGRWKTTRITLGRYPTLSLAAARATAKEYITIAAAGNDPRKTKREGKREQITASRNTFSMCREAFLEAGEKRGIKKSAKPWTTKTLSDYRGALAHFRDWDDLPMLDITRDDIQDAVDDICNIGDAIAHKANGTLTTMFGWCVRRGYVEHSPCVGVEPPKKKARERVLTDLELKSIWDACKDHRGPLADAMRVLMLTGQRRTEISTMRWDEIDLDTGMLSLSGNRTKNSLPHLVPLSPHALSIINSQKKRGEYVFTTTGKNPISGYSKVKRRIAEAAGVDDWRVHDFRRTMVTGLSEMMIMNEGTGQYEMRFEPHIIEAVVNHVSGAAKKGVAGVYNKAQYLPARINALNAWADHVQEILVGDAPDRSNVIELGASA
jgi:integrase